MMNNQTIEKLKKMRLSAMAEFHAKTNGNCRSYTPDEYLAMLVEHEWEVRHANKIDRLLYGANFKQNANIGDIDYTSSRNLDKAVFQRLASLSFLSKSENIIITGPSGLGKSYLAQAIGNQACLMEHKVKYWVTSRLFSHLKLSKADGTYLRELKKLTKFDLLILDDFGLTSFDNVVREILLDIIDDRYQTKSTIITSQIPVSVWYEMIGESTIADAILDRVINSSHRIDLKGDSLRKNTLSKE